MKTMLTTLCAASLCATPALAGVSPESFVSSLQRVVAAETAVAESVEGQIRSIADDKASFVLRTTSDRPMTIRLDDKTVYMLDGKKSDRDTALKVGRSATVQHDEGLASRVEVSSKSGS